MNENSNIESDVIKNNDYGNFVIDLHDSFSSSNKSERNEEKLITSFAKSKLYELSKKISDPEISSETKKNYISFSTNEINKNSISKKMSSQPSSINSTILSPSKKKKISSFKMIEKSKYNRNFDSPTKRARAEQETIAGRERRDAFGNEIKRRNRKKIKVTFADQIEDKKPLVNIIDIECFKKYNYIVGLPKEDTIKNNVSANCQCCAIFWLLIFDILL